MSGVCAPTGRRAFLCCSAAALAAMAGYATAQNDPRRIHLSARKFEFTPAEISAVAGQAVTLVVTTTDFAHGFSLPDFELRGDCMPGRELVLRLTPRKVGRFGFVCDNFCGEGHDEMSGILVVTAG